MTRAMATPYMEWAKLESAARCNLATSGAARNSRWTTSAGGPGRADSADRIAYGYAPLLERIAAHHAVRPAQVVTAAGCSMANFLALAALVEPGDEVLIEEPTYEPLLLAAAHLGARIVRFDRPAEDGFAIDPDDVAAAHHPAHPRHRAHQPAQPLERDAKRACWREIGEARRPRRRTRARGRGLPRDRVR